MWAESIEWYVEDKALSLSYDLAPHPHPLPSSPVSKLSLYLSLHVRRRSSLLMGEEGSGGGVRGAKSHVLYKSFNTLWVCVCVGCPAGPVLSFKLVGKNACKGQGSCYTVSVLGLKVTVKKAVELLDVPSRNSFLMSNNYNSTVEILYS